MERTFDIRVTQKYIREHNAVLDFRQMLNLEPSTIILKLTNPKQFVGKDDNIMLPWYYEEVDIGETKNQHEINQFRIQGDERFIIVVI